MKQEKSFKYESSKSDYNSPNDRDDNENDENEEEDNDDMRVTGGGPSFMTMKKEMLYREGLQSLPQQSQNILANPNLIEPSSSYSDLVLSAPQPIFLELSQNYSFMPHSSDPTKGWVQLSSNIEKSNLHLNEQSNASTFDQTKQALSGISSLTNPLYSPYYFSQNGSLPSIERYENTTYYPPDQSISSENKD